MFFFARHSHIDNDAPAVSLADRQPESSMMLGLITDEWLAIA